MKQENYTKALVIVSSFIFLIVCFSGCTSNQNTNENENTFSGTWIGNVQMPLFGRAGNATISQLTFSGNTVEMTLDSEQGTFTTTYTYSMNGTTLVLEPQFNGRGGFPGQQPYNGTRPGNWTMPENGTWNPGGGRPSMSISFTYSVNEDYTVLHLNGAEFRKI